VGVAHQKVVKRSPSPGPRSWTMAGEDALLLLRLASGLVPRALHLKTGASAGWTSPSSVPNDGVRFITQEIADVVAAVVDVPAPIRLGDSTRETSGLACWR
jgi:hypothetical protein